MLVSYIDKGKERKIHPGNSSVLNLDASFHTQMLGEKHIHTNLHDL